MVAVWTWLGGLAPPRIRGRYFGRRQAWQAIALIFAVVLAWFSAWANKFALFGNPRVLGDIAPFGLGTLLLLCSLVPLAAMRSVDVPPPVSGRTIPIKTLLADRPFRRFLIFGCWVAVFNGMVQSPQHLFNRQVLALEILPLMLLQAAMFAGQLILALPLGRLADKVGNRPVLIVCQLLFATGTLFAMRATRAEPWWIAGMWLMYSFSVGLDICLPNLTLRLAPRGAEPAYLAIFQGITAAAFALSTIGFAPIFAEVRYRAFPLGPWLLGGFAYFFYLGWVTRSIGALLVAAVAEPGAWSLGELLRGRRKKKAERVDPLSPF
jgi:MFS family permease